MPRKAVFIFDSSYPSTDVALPVEELKPHVVVSDRIVEPPPGHRVLLLNPGDGFASFLENVRSLRVLRVEMEGVKCIVIAAPRVRPAQLLRNAALALCVSTDISFFDGASFHTTSKFWRRLLKEAAIWLAKTIFGGMNLKLKAGRIQRAGRSLPASAKREGDLYGLYTSARAFGIPIDEQTRLEDASSIYGDNTSGWYLPAFSNRRQRYRVKTTRHRLSDVTLHVESVNGAGMPFLFKGGRILEYPYLLGRMQRAFSYPVQTYAGVKSIERGINLLAYTSGYYHWLVEGVPRILDLIDDGFDFEQYPLILPPLAPFQRQLLELFGIDPDRQVISVSEGEWCNVGECIFPTASFPFGSPDLEDPSGQPDRTLLLRIRNRLLERLPNSQPGGSASPRKLYISRAAAAKRKFTPEIESAITSVLESAGFEKVCLEDLPWISQIRLVASAESIVGLHGAGLTNLVFAPNLHSLIEFHNPMEARPYFAVMARELGIPYAYIVGSLDGESPNFDNIVVDPGAVEVLIGRMESAFAGRAP